MKNKRIVDSWNKIGPDGAAEARMLDSILSRNHAEQSKKKTAFAMANIFNWRRYAPIAACLIVAAVLGNNAGWFGGKTLAADLGGGNTLNFYKSNSVGGEASFAWDADWGESISRGFTADEKTRLLGGIEMSYGGAIFRSADGAFMRYEGKTTGDIRVILSANGFPVTDDSVSGNEEYSEINGVPVTAGYFVTDANSKGVKTIIYFASFEVNGAVAYLELGGDTANSASLRAEISALVNALTLNPPDTSLIMAE